MIPTVRNGVLKPSEPAKDLVVEEEEWEKKEREKRLQKETVKKTKNVRYTIEEVSAFSTLYTPSTEVVLFYIGKHMEYFRTEFVLH